MIRVAGSERFEEDYAPGPEPVRRNGTLGISSFVKHRAVKHPLAQMRRPARSVQKARRHGEAPLGWQRLSPNERRLRLASAAELLGVGWVGGEGGRWLAGGGGGSVSGGLRAAGSIGVRRSGRRPPPRTWVQRLGVTHSLRSLGRCVFMYFAPPVYCRVRIRLYFAFVQKPTTP